MARLPFFDSERREEPTTLEHVLVGIFSGGVLLAETPRLGYLRPWLDELASREVGAAPWSEISAVAAADHHLPLYFYALKAWSSIFGDSLVALRALSVVFGVLALVALFAFSARVFAFAKLANPRALAAATAAWGAILQPVAYWSVRVRMYTLLAALVMVSAALLLSALEKMTRARWAQFSIVAIAGVYTHYFAILTIGVMLAFGLAARMRLEPGASPSRRLRKALPVIVSGAAIAVSLLLLLPRILSESVGAGGFWAPPLTLRELLSYAGTYALKTLFVPPILWALPTDLVACALVLTLSLLTLWRRRAGEILSLAAALGPVATLALLSVVTGHGLLYDRYLLSTYLFFLTVVVAALARIRRARVRWGLAIVIGLLLGIGRVTLTRVWSGQPNALPEAAAYLASASGEQDVVVSCSLDYFPLRYYWPDARLRLYSEWGPKPWSFADPRAVIEPPALTALRGRIFTIESDYYGHGNCTVPPSAKWTQVDERKFRDGDDGFSGSGFVTVREFRSAD